MKNTAKITRKEMIRLLNEDLAREFQAVIAYVVYSQTMKGAKFQAIAAELKKHASEELDHAIKIAKQIDYFNGTPVTVPKPVKLSDKAEDMLQFDLKNEADTIKAYRERIRQADAMGEFGLSEVLRKIIAQEQEHLTDLADALGIDNPKLSGLRQVVVDFHIDDQRRCGNRRPPWRTQPRTNSRTYLPDIVEVGILPVAFGRRALFMTSAAVSFLS